MSQQCVLLHAQCRGCGKKGHVRKDCQETVEEVTHTDQVEDEEDIICVLDSNGLDDIEVIENEVTCENIPKNSGESYVEDEQGFEDGKDKGAFIKCKVCELLVPRRRRQMLAHSKIVHKFKCIDGCGLAFTQERLMYNHCYVEHNNTKHIIKKGYQVCPECSEFFLSGLKRSYDLHVTAGIHLTCKKCELKFGQSRKEEYRFHCDFLHRAESDIPCGTCDLVFSSSDRKMLERHRKQKHVVGPCPHCRESSAGQLMFVTQERFAKHHKEKHLPYELLGCYCLDMMMNGMSESEVDDSDSDDESQGIKRKNDDLQSSPCSSKSVKHVQETDTNNNVITILLDDEENNPEGIGKGTEDLNPTDMKSRNRCKKSPNLVAGKYTILSVHLELFRSNKLSSNKLTQIGCVVLGSNPCLFFKAVTPCGLEKYLDHCKLGGDLLQALHMTREDDGTFLFRSRFEAIEGEKIICIKENEALQSFLDFLGNYPNSVLLGVDEDTISILAQKLKNLDREKFSKITGFTYWKRVLKYLDMEDYKSIELEEYYAKIFGEDLPCFNTASDIASVVLRAVKEVTGKEKEGKKSLDADFYKLCKRIECIEHPVKFDHDIATDVENVEVYNSFRPGVSASFTAVELDEIVVSSDSDAELEETRGSQAGFYTASPPLPVHPNPNHSSNSGIWQLGNPTSNGGIIVCPSPKCGGRLRYSNISNHLLKQHPNLLGLAGSLLCPGCKRPVSANCVLVHMNKCAPNGVLCP